MTDIQVQKTSEDLASRSLQITIPVDRVAAAEAHAVHQYARRARIPGFRPGKAPEAVIRKRFSSEIRESALQEVLRAGWERAKESESLAPIADPSIRNLKYEEGQPVEFELLVEVQPKLTLTTTGGFTVTRTLPAVSDDLVAEQIEKVREEKATWIPVEGERPGPGQMVRVEVAPLEEGTVHEAKPYTMVLGSGQAIPDLEERIMRLLPGEETETDVRLPEDFPDETRRGQTRRVRILLHDVKRQELPPLDDSFARELGEFDSLDAVRQAVRTDLEAEASRSADAEVRAQVIRRIAEANRVEAPRTMVERALGAFARAYEVPEDQFEAFANQFAPVAAERVVRDLIVAAVAEAEALRATEEDVDARVARIAESRGLPTGQVYASLQKANRLAEIEMSVTEEKVFAFLLSTSTVTEVAS